MQCISWLTLRCSRLVQFVPTVQESKLKALLRDSVGEVKLVARKQPWENGLRCTPLDLESFVADDDVPVSALADLDGNTSDLDDDATAPGTAPLCHCHCHCHCR